MTSALVLVFVVVYVAIALEHPLRINKAASALLGAGLLWTIYATSTADTRAVTAALGESLTSTAQIIFFLLGAMTIVEVVDAHNGFEVITARIGTSSLTRLMWLVGVLTFFLSAVLDNLTTTIVMVSLVRKLIEDDDDRRFFAGIIVVAANAGGAWSPIGDVTTTMLWIGGQITSFAIVKAVLLPSIVNVMVPLSLVAYRFRGRQIVVPQHRSERNDSGTEAFERNLMFYLGLGILVSVPVFKALTHLPPFMGILFGLGLLWLVGDLVHRHKDDEVKQPLTLAHALGRIDLSSIVFFIGILLAVATLEYTHVLASVAGWLDEAVGQQVFIVLIIGLVSAIVDNVPLVAAAMGMYSLAQYPPDHFFWAFLAYCAGTGGSILIVGSAAGVAAMGLERMHFLWYLRKIGGLALLGYLAGAGVYLLQICLLN